jgi:hypothetical protein
MTKHTYESIFAGSLPFAGLSYSLENSGAKFCIDYYPIYYHVGVTTSEY